MQVRQASIPDVLILAPRVFNDERGFFSETFNQETFDVAVGHHVRFVQDNHSHSVQGVLRGMHYQLPPRAQGKLVRVVSGAVFDVAVDVRRSSPWYGKWVGIELSAENHLQLWIPPGFAHGFLVLSATADFEYKTTDYYAPDSEASIRFDDPSLGIRWPGDTTQFIVSARDRQAPDAASAKVFP